jgi:cytochrome c oxidase subunit 2
MSGLLLHAILLCSSLVATATGTSGVTPENFWMPEGASEQAGFIDYVFDFINWVNYVSFALITVVMVWFCIRYRQRSKTAGFAPGPVHNTALEVTWTIIPTLILVGIFFMGFVGYLDLYTPPKNSYDIKVTAKQWAWTFEYPNGAKSTSELVVPAGQPVRLVMRSDDVLHSLYIPDFRVKQDVVPGRYTYLWFESNAVNDPEDPTDFRWLFCTEYCGESHWNMNVHVKVFEEEAFDKWTKEQARWLDVIDNDDLYFMAGPKLYARCAACHSLDGTDMSGPSWGARAGMGNLWERVTEKTGKIAGGRKAGPGVTTLADYIGEGKLYGTSEDYIRSSIYDPGALLVSGFSNGMATFQGQLNDRAIDALIGMMQNLDEFNPDGSFKDEDRIKQAEERIRENKEKAAEAAAAAETVNIASSG